VLAEGAANAAACGAYNPVVSVAPKTGEQSKAFTISWGSTAPAACTNAGADDWGGTHHVELHRAAGTGISGTPAGSANVASLAWNVTAKDNFVFRSDKDYAYRIFACEDVDCLSWYGDGSGGGLEVAINTSDTDSTEVERWMLDGTASEGDVHTVLLEDSDANAPHIFFYPPSWATGLSGKMVMLYSKARDPGTGNPSEVYYWLHDAVGWPAGGFVASASWDSPVLIANGSTVSTAADYGADHPWAMFFEDNVGAKFMQLFVQSQNGTGNANSIIQITSVDADGDDFGLVCGTSCTTTIMVGGGSVAILGQSSGSSPWVRSAQHSRLLYDYIATPWVVAGTNMPTLLFQMLRPSLGNCADAGPTDDLGWADGTWSSDGWTWDVQTETAAPFCPVVQVDDVHDNTMIPLPNGEFKVYYKEAATHDFKVVYWNGTDWEDEANIEFTWEGSTTLGPTDDCAENVATVIYSSGGAPKEGMAMKMLDTNDCPNFGTIGSTGLDSGGGSQAAIVFANLDN
jgi:hypothetical protein